MAARAPETVAAVPIDHRPWRLVDRHEVDLPRWRALSAGQKGDIVFAADRQKHGWLDLDRPRAAADSSSVSDLGAAESSRRETAVAEMFGSRIDGALLIAARTVDRRFEPKGG